MIRLVISAAVWRANLLFAGWLAFPFVSSAAEPLSYSIHWNTNSNPTIVEVRGADAKSLRALQRLNWQTADWQKLFSVFASQGDVITDVNLPPMLGTYRIEDNLIRFQPKFSLAKKVNYRAVFRPSRLPSGVHEASDVVSSFRLPVVAQKSTTVVTQIYPSADVLPENLLKFYVHFSAPMRSGHIYDHIHLRDGAGKPVELPFLEIDEELWNPEMTRLTLFIDPGRIKRGVQPLEEIGPALEAGKNYTLEIDSAWQDNAGLPLRESFRKSFKVGPPDRDPPSPATWRINPPPANTRNPLTVDFAEPMDQALALRVIRVADVAGKFVEGVSALSNHERRWSFTPQKPWTAGRHQLQIQNTIEDLAGNNIGKAFEVDLFEDVQQRFTNSVIKLEFVVK